MKGKRFFIVIMFLVSTLSIFLNSNLVKAGWESETVDNSGDVIAYFSSLAVDSGDRPHISYADPSGNTMYASYNGSNWEIETVDYLMIPITPSLPPYNSIALDSTDIPHISVI